MPNHVTSELIFRCLSPEQHAELIANVLDAEGDVDFNILVPAPLNLWRGNVGTRHQKAFKRTAMDWNSDNWGTKWNAYDSRPARYEDGILTLVFDTAWAPPYPWLAAVFNRFALSFEHNWLDEGAGWSVSGIFDADEMKKALGDPWREERASQEVQERLHFLKWGCARFEDEDEGDQADA